VTNWLLSGQNLERAGPGAVDATNRPLDRLAGAASRASSKAVVA
jgi:hypothetical protein